ncbi:MAG: tRNA pseudouridine(38-40) synthase TruA [bacterium]
MKIALLIEYDGKDFAGWQVQPDVRTVQGEIESAFTKILQQKIPVTASGRTDTGVHAHGMVAHARIEEIKFGLEKLAEALNAESAQDIVIHSIREVPEDFHARFSAVDREYRYTIIRKRTAIERDATWYVRGDLNLDAMKSCVDALIGDHDFTSFSKLSDDVEHYRCLVNLCSLETQGDKLIFTIRANRFVRGMVRALVGSIVEVGKSKLNFDNWKHLLTNPIELDRARYIAPAQGLTLWKIRYPQEFHLWE